MSFDFINSLLFYFGSNITTVEKKGTDNNQQRIKYQVKTFIKNLFSHDMEYNKGGVRSLELKKAWNMP
jgi:hypothetical protein